MNGIELGVFSSRITAVCEEMGVILRGAAFSPNIKDRLDFSCAVFDAEGSLCAQAAHIPVHLGSMAYAMADIVGQLDWCAGDVVAVNDPFLGGTHLPDVTLISPVFIPADVDSSSKQGANLASDQLSNETLIGFIANRAHHANIGAHSPGSMPISRSLEEEGVLIPPTFVVKRGVIVDSFFENLSEKTGLASSTSGDFAAQMSANQVGVARLSELVRPMGCQSYVDGLIELNEYAAKLARSALAKIPNGEYEFTDLLDDDGAGQYDIRIQAKMIVREAGVEIDFTGTDLQVDGNINCPLSVAAAAVYYVFRCLMPSYTPACQGAFSLIRLSAPDGCLLNARRPAAVAAGNVETSTRVVDVILGCLAQAIPEQIPAASHGSMNNVAMGMRSSAEHEGWDYYETIGGGMGASMTSAGLDGVQTHMTNTLNTPIESLESHYPLRVNRYALRKNSGGKGLSPGGDGLIREFEFLSPALVSLLTERRRYAPWGLHKGESGKVGENYFNGVAVEGKREINAQQGDVLSIHTPGAGGWGEDC